MATRKSVLNLEEITKKLNAAGVADVDSILKELEGQINKSIKQKIKETQPSTNEAYDSGEHFLEV